jgi:hypothetical protein
VGGAAAGVGRGLVTVAVVYGLLRYDCRAVPAYMATGVVMEFVESALQKGTASAVADAAIVVAVAALTVWCVTRYLERAHVDATAIAGSPEPK